MTYTELLKANAELKLKLETNSIYNIEILSNTIVNQSKPFIEYNLRNVGIHANVSFGNYDNILQDASLISDKQLVIIFWDLCNLIDGFQYQANIIEKEILDQIVSKTKGEIDIVFNSLREVPLLLMNRFSTLPFNHALASRTALDQICDELNSYLDQKKQNIYLIEIDKIVSMLSVSKSFDLRNYYSSKALYSIDFFAKYSEFIIPIVLSVQGKSKKALVLDCDNTLWNGIIGEDGMNNIQMSSKSPKGVPFHEVQSIIKCLAERGVIVCLNSKNNEEDVNEVLNKHPDMILREQHIVLKMINWKDKVSNLRDIAQKLNIGLDSLVFIDDSDFEIELVKEYLPEVETVKVPKSGYLYPEVMRKVSNYFFSISSTKEDQSRINSYKSNLKRNEDEAKHLNIDDYLKSLELQMSIYLDEPSQIERMSQLSQKTNQFNLTTKRYTNAEIRNFTESKDCMTFVFKVEDKFGDFGITGMAIVLLNGKNAIFDTFLMSCRVIGRNLEYAFMNHILNELRVNGIGHIEASYKKTIKNEQVEMFFEKAGFVCSNKSQDQKEYELDLTKFTSKDLPYIKVKYERQN